VEAQINAFIATVPDGSTIQFQPGGCYGQDNTIYITNRSNLVIDGNGATFKALSLAAMGVNSNWAVEAGSNITLEDMTIQGDNPYAGILQGSPGCYNASLEWQYGIAFDATQGGTVNDVNINDVYGDFVEAEDYERNTASAPARNILVENSNFNGNGRMGIGITDAQGVTIQNNHFNGVCWEMVDVELDSNIEYGQNISIINNTLGTNNFGLLSNQGAGYGGAGEQNCATEYGGDCFHVGNFTVTGNTMTAVPATTQSPVTIGWPGIYRSNYTITNNYLISGGGSGMDLEGVSNSTITNNTVAYGSDQGCGPLGCPVGVFLVDCHNDLIEYNIFPYLPPLGASFPGGIDRIDSLSTGVTQVGNSL
jgi:hypothetical protein